MTTSALIRAVLVVKQEDESLLVIGWEGFDSGYWKLSWLEFLGSLFYLIRLIVMGQLKTKRQDMGENWYSTRWHFYISGLELDTSRTQGLWPCSNLLSQQQQWFKTSNQQKLGLKSVLPFTSEWKKRVWIKWRFASRRHKKVFSSLIKVGYYSKLGSADIASFKINVRLRVNYYK